MTYNENVFTLLPNRWEDRVQGAADVLGLIPGLNIPAEIVSGLISLKKGDYVGAALSACGLMPVEGEWAVALKIARTARQTAHTAAVARRVATAVRTSAPGSARTELSRRPAPRRTATAAQQRPLSQTRGTAPRVRRRQPVTTNMEEGALWYASYATYAPGGRTWLVQ